jgi:hypothetical protein
VRGLRARDHWPLRMWILLALILVELVLVLPTLIE